MGAAPISARFVFVRHGEVAEEWRGRFYGDHDVPLSPRGRGEARAAARRLAGVDCATVISSGLARAEYGAALVRAPRGLPRRDEPELRELARGQWVGLRPEELPNGSWGAWIAHPGTYRSPGGESLGDLSARVLPCLDRLAAEYAGRTCVLVLHSWVVRVAVCESLGLPLDAAARLASTTGGITVLDWTVSPSGPRHVVVAAFETDRIPTMTGAWYRGPRRS